MYYFLGQAEAKTLFDFLEILEGNWYAREAAS